MTKNKIIYLALFTLLTGCSSSGQQATEKYQGRPETKKLEGASAVGYDGAAIRKNVDNTLDKTDGHANDLDKALKTNEGQRNPQ